MLEINNVEASYKHSKVLYGLNLQVNKGDITCLIGRNGAGKTTLLKTIIGILVPDTGKIYYQNEDITKWTTFERARAGISYVPQGRGIFPYLTVEENLLMGLESCNNEIDFDQALTIMYDQFTILKTKSRVLAGLLSGGQQQQLAIARGLISKPKLLLLDEPTEGIQPSIVKEIEETILQLKVNGDVAILLVEQYLEFALALANYCYVMERGNFVVEGKPSEINSESIHQYLAI